MSHSLERSSTRGVKSERETARTKAANSGRRKITKRAALEGMLSRMTGVQEPQVDWRRGDG